jgi:hypothetical protein
VVIKQAHAPLLSADEGLNRNHIEQVVAKCNIQNWNSSNVHQRIKVANLANTGKVQKVLIVKP